MSFFPSSCVLSIHAYTMLKVSFRGLRSRVGAANPGIQERLKIIASEDGNSVEEIEDLEADFMKINREYDNHTREIQEEKERLRLKMIERKYFKKPSDPKLLTWEDLEQIRFLHESDPEKWSVEKLALSFPATEIVIQKVLKSKWKPSSPDRIKKYNESVLNNWKLFEKGSLVMSKELKDHVSRFTSRRSVSLPPSHIGLIETRSSSVTASSSEFRNIIESYKALESNENNSEIVRLPDPKNVPVSQTILENYRMRTEALENESAVQERSEATLGRRKHTAMRRKEDLSLGSEDNAICLRTSQNNQSNTEIIAGGKVQLPERIKIPHKCKGKASLFRVDDCFYDEDGEFLYRVPGMKR